MVQVTSNLYKCDILRNSVANSGKLLRSEPQNVRAVTAEYPRPVRRMSVLYLCISVSTA